MFEWRLLFNDHVLLEMLCENMDLVLHLLTHHLLVYKLLMELFYDFALSILHLEVLLTSRLLAFLFECVLSSGWLEHGRLLNSDLIRCKIGIFNKVAYSNCFTFL